MKAKVAPIGRATPASSGSAPGLGDGDQDRQSMFEMPCSKSSRTNMARRREEQRPIHRVGTCRSIHVPALPRARIERGSEREAPQKEHDAQAIRAAS